MKKISLFLILLFLEFSTVADDVSNLIVENCTSCHNLNNYQNKNIPSLQNLTKEEFIKVMEKYKDGDGNGVMARISKVLTNQDILKISEIIYNE